MLYTVCRAILRAIYFLIYRFEAVGLENIPQGGPTILCSNHINNLDPMTVGIKVDRKVHFMAKIELFKVPGLKQLITALGAFPVKRGGVSKETIRTALQLLSDNKVMGIFPEGRRSSTVGMGKKGAASIAFRSKATVIPSAIIGSYIPFTKMKIIYGPAVDLSEFIDNPSAEAAELATEKIMDRIRRMSETGTY